MSDRVQTARPASVAKRRWTLAAATTGIIGAFAFVGLATAPFLFKGATLQSEIAEQVRATTGLTLTAKGAARFFLLPQPHVSMADLHFADPSGTLKIDAVALEGTVRLLPLLVGRLEIATATLDQPRLDINLDGKAMPADSTIGRAVRNPGRPTSGNPRLGIVTLVDGTALFRRDAEGGDTLVNGVNVTIDWRNLDSSATLTGAVEFQGALADVAAWIGQPSSLLRGDHSAIALRIQSLPLDLSANGDFVSLPSARFRGRVSVTAPSLPAVLSLAGYDAALPAPFAALSMSGDATIGGGAVDLPNLHLHLDGNDYEGTLAYQNGSASNPTLAGTLATDQLSLAPFLSTIPSLLDAKRAWSTQKLKLDLASRIDLDLRISATHLRLPALVIDDAALAVMTRDERTEVALVEGKAYGGAVKGRASFGIAAGALSVRATGALVEADASALSWDVFGRQLAAGTLSVSANLESAGDTPNAFMKNLHGWAKGRASDGELSNVDLGHGLHELGRKRLDGVLPALRNGRTPFQTLVFGFRITDGIATVDEGNLKGLDSALAMDGSADIGRRALDLKAVATMPPVKGPDAAPDPAGQNPSLRFKIQGSFDAAAIVPDFAPAQVPAP